MTEIKGGNDMLNVATIGSSWITESFIKAIQLSKAFQLKAVYSRSQSNGKDLAQVFGADYYTDQLNNILFDPEVQVVYIASPNALHFEQAMRAIKAGKHCIIEKPMFTSVQEWHEAFDMADKMGVKIFEAAKHIHNRNYKRFRQLVKNKLDELETPFLGANLNLGKYNLDYLKFLAAEETGQDVPNVFNPDMATGNLMDLGVYPIYVAVDLFGIPQSVHYDPIKGHNGIDIYGNMTLEYQGFDIHIFSSMVSHSVLPSEFYFDDETVVVYQMSRIAKVDLVQASGEVATVISYTPENQLYDEVVAFSEMIKQGDDVNNQWRYEGYKQLSLQVHQVMDMLKRSIQA